jgi:hypothetical protein
MKNSDVSSLFKPIVRIFQKYNLTIFIVVLTSGLVAAVLFLNGVLQQSSDTSNYKSSTSLTSFDQVTINRVKQLHTSSNPSAADTALPAGRVNPFAE